MRILLLSYCFPPVPLIEAQVTAKVMAHVGAEIDVVCADPRLWRLPADHSLDGWVDERFGTVVRVRRPGASPLVSAWGRYPLIANRPDALRYLNRRVAALLRDLPLDDYDLLVTRSELHSIQLVPLELTRRPPWVAHLSDPWAGDRNHTAGPVASAVNRRLESRVLHAADALVFTSEQAAAFTLAHHSERVRAKARWVPHCFEQSLFAAPQGRERTAAPPGLARGDGPILVRHVGHMRWNRHPEPLFRALQALADERPDALATVRVELIGLIEPQMLDSPAARSLPTGLLAVRPPVDYRSSLREMAGADLLLVTETTGTNGIDLHAKVVDYAGARVPIAGIVPAGPTADLIAELGGWTASPDNPTAGGAALGRAIDTVRERRRRERPDWGDPAVRNRFDARTVGARLAEIYADVAGDRTYSSSQ